MTTTPTSSGGPQRRRRVLMFPLPFQGHINPMMQLAGVLHARGGLDITFFHAAFNAPDPARRPASYRFVPVGEGVPSADLLPSGGDRDFVAALLRINERLTSPFCDLLKRELAADDDAACLVVDSNLRGMQLIAEELGLPTLVLRPGAAACLVAYMAFPALCDKGLLPPSSQGVIINTFLSLEERELQKVTDVLNVSTYAIGPLHKISLGAESSLVAQDWTCLEWLDKQADASVLYVSFGSLASMEENELLETAWGLANSQRPFLWVIRHNSVQSSQQGSLPDAFKEASICRPDDKHEICARGVEDRI
ncbi:hypothetical protein PR202_gb12792 [Eleusine coracana subsp. coracana]|uniref:Uncharacterized protein n=1 Tax=Eleusine coracana subsp. coracana TaxID=191504 RepID=A0AAV5EQV1_ELECO|nr:hypothetical protein PR202_gb12792 [Eleusine coracana subsp. coracana]